VHDAGAGGLEMFADKDQEAWERLLVLEGMPAELDSEAGHEDDVALDDMSLDEESLQRDPWSFTDE